MPTGGGLEGGEGGSLLSGTDQESLRGLVDSQRSARRPSASERSPPRRRARKARPATARAASAPLLLSMRWNTLNRGPSASIPTPPRIGVAHARAQSADARRPPRFRRRARLPPMRRVSNLAASTCDRREVFDEGGDAAAFSAERSRLRGGCSRRGGAADQVAEGSRPAGPPRQLLLSVSENAGGRRRLRHRRCFAQEGSRGRSRPRGRRSGEAGVRDGPQKRPQIVILRNGPGWWRCDQNTITARPRRPPASMISCASETLSGG
jgi:hypothetical protein